MAVDTKLTDWEADFVSQDTNTPVDSATIGSTIGQEYRALKAVIKNDLSNTRDADVTYQTTTGFPTAGKDVPTPDRGAGKGYAVYKSIKTVDDTGGASPGGDPAPGAVYDILVYGLKPAGFGKSTLWTSHWNDWNMLGRGNVSDGVLTDNNAMFFWVAGDLTSLIYPGTKVCVMDESSLDVSKRRAAIYATLSGSAVGDVQIQDGGEGYTAAPAVAFYGGSDGSGYPVAASRTATITNGAVSGLSGSTNGSGYDFPPEVVVEAGGADTTFNGLVDGRNQTCVLTVIASVRLDSGPNELPEAEAYTKVFFHPPLNYWPTEFERQFALQEQPGSLGPGSGTSDSFTDTAPNITEFGLQESDNYNHFTISKAVYLSNLGYKLYRMFPFGRRIQFIEVKGNIHSGKATGRDRNGSDIPEPVTDLPYSTEAPLGESSNAYTDYNKIFYPERSYGTYIVADYASGAAAGTLWNGNVPVFKYAWQIAAYIDGMNAETAKEVFGEETEAVSGWESYESVMQTGYDVLTRIQGQSMTDSLTVIRMSDIFFLHDPVNGRPVLAGDTDEAGVTAMVPENACYLIGTQTGNKELSGEPHDVVTFTVTVERTKHSLSAGGTPQAVVPVGGQNTNLTRIASLLGGALSSYKGVEYRVSAQLIGYEGNYSFSDASKVSRASLTTPEVKMNIWSKSSGGTDWDSVETGEEGLEPSNRTPSAITLEYDRIWPEQIESATYDIQIVTPYSNGKTLYPELN